MGAILLEYDKVDVLTDKDGVVVKIMPHKDCEIYHGELSTNNEGIGEDECTL